MNLPLWKLDELARYRLMALGRLSAAAPNVNSSRVLKVCWWESEIGSMDHGLSGLDGFALI